MLTLAQILDGVVVKNGSAYQGLYVFPICLILPEPETGGEEPVTLEDGFKGGGLAVYETGVMDRVRIVNRSGRSAVALDGETLLGGAQNRIINAGALIRNGAEAELPSSCAEVRRWDCPRDKKTALPPEKSVFNRSNFAFGSLRRLKMSEAIHSLRKDRVVAVDQKKVWEHIVRQFGHSGASTKTLDLHDLYDFWEAPLNLFPPRFPAAPRLIGLIVFQDRDNWFLDLFAGRDIMFKYVKKIIRGHAFDTLIRIERELPVPASKKPRIEDARAALKSIKVAPTHKFKTGDSESCFFATSAAVGIAAFPGSSLLHLAACSNPKEFEQKDMVDYQQN